MICTSCHGMREGIERVARRLIEFEEDDPDGPTIISDRPVRWMLMIEDAQSIIALLRDPTEAMVNAAIINGVPVEHVGACWTAMIDAMLARKGTG